MNTRFPFNLKPQDAQRIIDVACNSWKHALASGWSKDIVLNKTISISEDFYKEMRAACTSEQHTLFDEIFGPYVDFSILNDTDVFYLLTGYSGYLFKGCDPFNKKVEFYSFFYEDKGINIICEKRNVIQLRLANKEELKIWEEYYPSKKVKVGDHVVTSNYDGNYDGRVLKVTEIIDEKYVYFKVLDGGAYNEHSNFSLEWTNFRLATKEEIDAAMCPYKDGELILVRDSKYETWYIRHSTGKMQGSGVICYASQNKSGGTTTWRCHAPTPKGFKLPE